MAADAHILGKPRDAAYVEVRQQIIQRLSYLILATLMMLAVSSFVMIKIVPSFQDIFWDFDLELPKVTLYVISFGEFFGNLPDGARIAAVRLAIPVGGGHRDSLPLRRSVLRPLIDRLTFAYHQAQLLRLFAVGFRQGLPVSETFKRLEAGSGAYACTLGRRRLQAAHATALNGKDWIEALRSARLVNRNDAASLTAAQASRQSPLGDGIPRRPQNATARLPLVGNYHHSLHVHRACFGFMVLWFAVGMFVPLIDLINNLAA